MTQFMQGKNIVVTGGAAGLGRAMALAFADKGANVAILDVNMDGAQETAKMVSDMGLKSWAHQVDLGDEAAIHAYAAEFMAECDSLDVLVNNAGLHMGRIAQGFADLSQAEWLHFFSINSVAPLLLAQALRPALAKAKGLIINQSSMASYVPASAYGITKLALSSISYGMATHFAGDEIRSVGIAPGLMATEAAKEGVAEENWARLSAMQQVKRGGTAQDIANLAVFLASPEGSFINNQIVSCDGGNQMRGWRQ